MSPLHLFYGGTFDPVHDGHLAVARAARAALGATIRFMPAADPPHRAPPGATAPQRAAMLDLAVEGESGMVVDRRELERQGPSFTVDTLHALRRELGPETPLALLVGADSLASLASWKDGLSLFGLTHFVVAERGGRPGGIAGDDALPGLPPALADALRGRWTADPAQLGAGAAGRAWRLHQPLHPASATDVRHRIAHGLPWRGLVPAAVADYIVAHGLYGAEAPAARSL